MSASSCSIPHVLIEPELEHEHCPQLLAVVFDSMQVLADQPRQGLVVENTLLLDSPFRECVQQQVAQLVSEPFCNRDAESLLPARQDVLRHFTGHGPLEN